MTGMNTPTSEWPVASDVSYEVIDSESIQRGETMGNKGRSHRDDLAERTREDIRLTFQFESRQTSFALPIFLNLANSTTPGVARSAFAFLRSADW